jgi:hypothetical protein
MSRRPSSRLRLEALETRCNLSAMSPFASPLADTAHAEASHESTTADQPTVNISAFAGQTVRTAAVSHASLNGQVVSLGNTVYVGTAGGGVWKTVDGAHANGHGTHVAGTIGAMGNNAAASHEFGHALGFRHEHTRPAASANANEGMAAGGAVVSDDGGDSDESVAMSGYVKVKKLSSGGG